MSSSVMVKGSSPSTKNKLGLLMVDFDNTCNVRDTCELFYKTSQTYRNAGTEEQHILDQKWKKVTGKYLQDYYSLISKSLEKYADKNLDKYNEHGLQLFLNDIAEFNVDATRDVDESELIVGADHTGLEWAAKQVLLYPGCLDLLKSTVTHVRVVSVNWSTEFIGYSLDNVIPANQIFANHLLNKNGVSDGIVGKEMISSYDKLKVMQSLLKKDEFDGVHIFVGDSITDLLCLIHADLGIIIGDSASLLKTASSFGVKILPMSALLNGNSNLVIEENCNQTPTLFKANSWHEIVNLVKRLS
eukprot:gene8805-9746_t